MANETAIAEAKTGHEKRPAADKAATADAPKRPKPHRALPAHLPRIERVVEPETRLCPCGCGEMVRIGEDRSHRLDVVPAQYRVLVTIRPRYACPKGRAGVVQAPAPAHLIEGGRPTFAIVLEPCVDGSRGARALFGGWVWSVAAMCTASDVQRGSCAP